MDRKRIAAEIRDYLARERMSREQFAFKTKLGKSTVDKLLTGMFSDRTLSIVESETRLQLRDQTVEATSVVTVSTPRNSGPDGPSIAVLPFSNMGSDPEQEFFADGISEDIITSLSRLRWLFVIARNSTFTFKGRAVDVRDVAQQLGVRYVLEGSVRTSAGRIRINSQLIDATNGKHIWAERYDRALNDIFDVQDEITSNVVASIEPHLYAAESIRASERPPESIDAWGLVVRALGLINRIGRLQNEEAQALLTRAIEIDPDYAKAHAVLGWAFWWAAQAYWSPDGGPEAHHRAEMHAETALSLDPAEPWGRMVRGLCLSTKRRHEQALVELRTALEINPNFALGRAALGWALLRAGQFDEAIEQSGKPLHMSPTDSFAGIYTATHGLALLGARRFTEALPFLRSSAAVAPYPGHYNALISCCGHLGLLDEARFAIEARNRVGPPVRISVLRRNLGGYAHAPVFFEGLEKAGVPE